MKIPVFALMFPSASITWVRFIGSVAALATLSAGSSPAPRRYLQKRCRLLYFRVPKSINSHLKRMMNTGEGNITTETKPRLFFVDNLRTLCITLVFLTHLAITYGGSGLWYYKEGSLTDPEFYIFLTFTIINQAFFMGLLFLLAGYFTPTSFDRKGPGQFTLDRLTRLWLPVGVFIFLIDPFMQYALISAGVMPSPTGSPLSAEAFLGLFTNPLNGLGFGPLWFIEALFYFSLIYVVWRLFSRQPTKPREMPRNLTIAFLAVGLGAASFLVRRLPLGYVLNPFGSSCHFSLST